MTAPLTLAQYHMDYGDHMGDGWGWGMFAAMVLIALAVIALVVWLVRTLRPPAPPEASSPDPMDVLKRRLASGEITPDEYRERAEILAGK